MDNWYCKYIQSKLEKRFENIRDKKFVVGLSLELSRKAKIFYNYATTCTEKVFNILLNQIELKVNILNIDKKFFTYF